MRKHFVSLNSFELPCLDGRKSFYGKAIVHKTDEGTFVLQSYETCVGEIDRSRKFHRLWDDYSATTMRHVNSFLKYYLVPGGGKKWWNSLPVEEPLYEDDLSRLIRRRKEGLA